MYSTYSSVHTLPHRPRFWEPHQPEVRDAGSRRCFSFSLPFPIQDISSNHPTTHSISFVSPHSLAAHTLSLEFLQEEKKTTLIYPAYIIKPWTALPLPLLLLLLLLYCIVTATSSSILAVPFLLFLLSFSFFHPLRKTVGFPQNWNSPSTPLVFFSPQFCLSHRLRPWFAARVQDGFIR